MKYQLADLVIEFTPNYEMMQQRLEKYCTNENAKTDFSIDITPEMIQNEIRLKPELNEESAEYIVLGAEFYKKLLQYHGCVLHSSAVVLENEAYLFSAPCGTGKSTHAALWEKYLGATILNDDNPAIRILKDGIYAYGTPFSGKNDLSTNTKAKIKGICFIEQSKTNFIEKMEPKEAIQKFLDQTVRELNQPEMFQLLEILDKILKEIPIYRFGCNISEEAVKMSYTTMKGETNEN